VKGSSAVEQEIFTLYVTCCEAEEHSHMAIKNNNAIDKRMDNISDDLMTSSLLVPATGPDAVAAMVACIVVVD
jgi:hypothetical protein